MAATYRKTHISKNPESLGPRRPTVVQRISSKTGLSEFRVIQPASVSLQQFREGRRYHIVRGHLVYIPNKGPMTNSRNERARRQMAALRSARGNRCEVCETTAQELYEQREPQLEFAHTADTELSGKGRGRKERISDISRHPENYALLCKPCHREFDEVLGPVPMEQQ